MPVSLDSSRESGGVVVMLLDNHYGPDRRVENEMSVLTEGGIAVRIAAWERRQGGNSETVEISSKATLVRIAEPNPPRGGMKSIVRLLSWCSKVWMKRKELLRDARTLVVHDVYLLPLGYLLSTVARVPLVYDAHEDFRALEEGRYPEWLIRSVLRMESSICRRAYGVVVPGYNRIERWKKVGISPVVFPNIGDLASGDKPDNRESRYSVAYCGSLDPNRRIDLLIDWARINPDHSVAIAGEGRNRDAILRMASDLPNVEIFPWVSDPQGFLSQAKVVYYGLDSKSPYSNFACPNTLYISASIRRPLVFFCGGEPLALSRRFNIGVQALPQLDSLDEAIHKALATNNWEFDACIRSLRELGSGADYLRLISGAVAYA